MKKFIFSLAIVATSFGAFANQTPAPAKQETKKEAKKEAHKAKHEAKQEAKKEEPKKEVKEVAKTPKTKKG